MQTFAKETRNQDKRYDNRSKCSRKLECSALGEPSNPYAKYPITSTRDLSTHPSSPIFNILFQRKLIFMQSLQHLLAILSQIRFTNGRNSTGKEAWLPFHFPSLSLRRLLSLPFLDFLL